MVSSPSPPPAPDPVATANAQGAANTKTAIAQTLLNDTSQVTPYGSITYSQDGTWPGSGGSEFGRGGGGGAYGRYGPGGWGMGGGGGTVPQDIPKLTATTTLSPGMQALFDKSLSNAQGAANIQGTLQNNVAATEAKPLDLSWGATEQNLDKLNQNTLDPQWAQAAQQLNQSLSDQGITPGSEGWKTQQQAFGLNKANAYDQMFLQGHQQAVNDITSEYNSPINTLNALKSQAQVAQPGIGQLAPTAQSSIQPPNYQGIVQSNYAAANQAYAAQMQQQSSMMSGLMGLGGSLFGGGGGSLGGLFSDRKDKTDIQKLGDDPKGWGIYAYRYKGDSKSVPKTVGPMADEVEKAMPGSTAKIGGHQVIKPSAFARFGLNRRAA